VTSIHHQRCDVCGNAAWYDPFAASYCRCGALVVPAKGEPLRGRGPSERRLSDITTALDRVRSSALESAYRNESKPHWREESRETLALYLGEECGELMQALRRGTLDDVLREAGDLVWAVAMLVDAHQSKA
jgi:NTP pyrophosphatase (non-canonical NTP hydrolase)